MKVSFYQYVSVLSLCFFCWAMPAFSQKASEVALHQKPTTVAKPNVQPSKPLPTPATPVLLAKPSVQLSADCDNDQTPPEIHCPAGTCNPLARAAYVRASYGEPWGYNHNPDAMNAVFGPGNWDLLYFEYLDPSALLSANYRVIFLEGSYYSGNWLQNFISANGAALENWVASGGALFINCAYVDGPSTLDFGFDGVTFQGYVSGFQAIVQNPAHPIFNGPFVPANGDFYGSEFHYGYFYGNAGSPLLVGQGVCLTEKTWGAGLAIFGSIIPPTYDGPHPNVDNMYQNIVAYLNAQCDASLAIAADAGQCFATITDQSLDATATDDCTLVSLTHDVAGAPSNTTLAGATLPVGLTKVVWTATDAAGNTSTCEKPVFVREQEAPTITCPQDLSVNAEPGTCTGKAEYAATATDNCSAAPTISYNYAPGGAIPFGVSTIIASASDISGNHASCSFVVSVLPNPEICNGFDDDCDGWTDEDVTDLQTFYLDSDWDGYGDPAITTTAYGCYPPYGYSANSLDCNDHNYYIHPNNYEYCNGVDDNCDGNIDEGVTPTWYQDADGDGYGNHAVTIISCDQPQGYVYDGTDCDDTERYIHPGALEDCTNTTDENCDGILGDNNFIIEETHADVFCGSAPDGKISITMTPPQNYYVIQWSNGAYGVPEIGNLQAGTYKVTVSNECGTTKTKSIVIQPSQTPALQVVMTGTAQICGGQTTGAITATASEGCGNYTYEWQNGSTDASLSGLSGGYYGVVVTDACGCTAAGQFVINQPEPIGLYGNTIIPLLDGTYFVQVIPYGGAAPYQFRRSDNGGFTPWGVSNGFIGVPAGDIVFEVQDQFGCSAQITINLTPLSPKPLDGGNEAQEKSEAEQRSESPAQSGVEPWAVTLFPNPNTGVFNVTLPENLNKEVTFYLTDITGRIVHTQKVEAGNSRPGVQAGDLPPGTYFLQVLSGGHIKAVEKLEKQ